MDQHVQDPNKFLQSIKREIRNFDETFDEGIIEDSSIKIKHFMIIKFFEYLDQKCQRGCLNMLAPKELSALEEFIDTLYSKAHQKYIIEVHHQALKLNVGLLKLELASTPTKPSFMPYQSVSSAPATPPKPHKPLAVQAGGIALLPHESFAFKRTGHTFSILSSKSEEEFKGRQESQSKRKEYLKQIRAFTVAVSSETFPQDRDQQTLLFNDIVHCFESRQTKVDFLKSLLVKIFRSSAQETKMLFQKHVKQELASLGASQRVQFLQGMLEVAEGLC